MSRSLGSDTGSLSCWRTKEPHLEMIGVVSAAHRATTKPAVTGDAAYTVTPLVDQAALTVAPP